MITIPLSQGKSTTVDDIDADLRQFNWCIRVRRYAGRRENGTGRGLMLHRIILERVLNRSLDPDEYVDHINGDPLDNRRSNIRLCSSGQNQMNSDRGDTRGVWQHPNGRWRARICINGKTLHLGYFDTRELAIDEFRKAAEHIHGEYSFYLRPTDGHP